MTITTEKIEALAKYMGENEKRAEMLMELSAEEACAKINADGYNITVEELVEFAQGMSAALNAKNGELDEAMLSNVAGGTWVRDAYDIYVSHCYWAQKKGYEWGRKIGNWLFK